MPADLRVGLATLPLLLGLLAGCSSSGDSAPDAAPTSPAPSASASASASADTPQSYAALGDSYSAAPFVPQTDLAGGCFRSTGNYASLVAEDLDITDVTDVTCSAADTSDIAGRQAVAGGRGTVPPQVRAVGPDTDLVTLGIGGNDENLFATLIQACAGATVGGATSCDDVAAPEGPAVDALLRRTTAHVAAALRLIHAQAPDATAVLVGYPRLVDPARPCPLIPIPDAELPGVAALERNLRDALAAAARRSDADFVDMYAVSKGHEICSDVPWVNGARTDQTRALAYHPFDVEQRAVADQVEDLVARGGAS